MRIIFALAFLAAFQVHGDTIWQELRQSALLTDQNSKSNRNDLCVAAAAVNLAQGLAKQLNRAPMTNPHAVFESIVENYPGVNDDIGLFEMTQILATVLTRALPQEKLKIEAALLDHYTEKNMNGIRPVERLTWNDLIPGPNEEKMLNIDLFDGKGNYVGGHAIVVESFSSGELKFVNSFEPKADSRAKAFENAGSMWKGHQIPTFEIVSPTPKGTRSPHAFFVRGVITVKKIH